MNARQAPAEQLVEKVEFDTNGGCWLWAGALYASGYGMAKSGRRTMRAHRALWLATRGRIPAGLNVLHRCDVRACINPEHLFLGTHEENMADMVAKGRSARGQLKPEAKLTDEAVRDIRQGVASGQRQSEFVRKYGVSASLVCGIVQGRGWRHLEPTQCCPTCGRPGFQRRRETA